ncbi:hypothetical protein VTH06DRAFT_6412 [Thermothelomyces fergusii]
MSGQSEGLIVLGVCLGVAVALALFWYTCGRAHVGPLKEIQMIKKGKKMRKEVRTVHVVQIPPSSFGSSSGRQRSGPYSTSSTESGSSSDDSHEATSTSDPYTTPATVTTEAAMGPAVTVPPAAHVNPNHAMNYLDPTINVTANGVVEPDPRLPPRHAQGGSDSIGTPLGRQASTSLPLHAYQTNGGFQSVGVTATAYYQPPTNLNPKGPENYAQNYWDV